MQTCELLNVIKRHNSPTSTERENHRELICKVARLEKSRKEKVAVNAGVTKQHSRSEQPSASGRNLKLLRQKAQIHVANLTSNLAVTHDDLIPQLSDSVRVFKKGSGRWKSWTSRTCLKVGFQSSSKTTHALASELDRQNSRHHVTQVQNCVAHASLQEQHQQVGQALNPPTPH